MRRSDTGDIVDADPMDAVRFKFATQRKKADLFTVGCFTVPSRSTAKLDTLRAQGVADQRRTTPER